MMALARLRDNLTRSGTRWLTVGSLVGSIVATVGASLEIIIIIVTIVTGEPVETRLSVSANAVTLLGVVLAVFFSVALSRRLRSGEEKL